LKKHTISLIKPSNPNTDPRLIKELDSIIKGGYSANIICMCKNILPIPCHGVNIYNLAFNGRKNFFSLTYWPIWWIFEFYSLFLVQSEVFHVINYNSIFPAIIVGKIRKIPVIYEILDTTYDSIKMPSILRNVIQFFDKTFMKYSDAIILVDECQIKQFKGIPNDNLNVIYDSAFDCVEIMGKKDKKREKFTMLYVGVLYKKRQLNLEILFNVINDINNVEVIIAGYGDLVDDIKQWENRSNGKIKYVGPIDYHNALKLSLDADCLFVLRNCDLNTNKYICGSKIWESMMCARPILVNMGTSTAKKVLKEECGLVVCVDNLSDLKNKIILMRDNPELCKTLGERGRKAYDERYCWNIMEKKLQNLYKLLINGADVF